MQREKHELKVYFSSRAKAEIHGPQSPRLAQGKEAGKSHFRNKKAPLMGAMEENISKRTADGAMISQGEAKIIKSQSLSISI